MRVARDIRPAADSGNRYSAFRIGSLKPMYVPELMPINASMVALNSGMVRSHSTEVRKIPSKRFFHHRDTDVPPLCPLCLCGESLLRAFMKTSQFPVRWADAARAHRR